MNKTPHQLAEDRIVMSAEFGRLSDELGGLLEKQAKFFVANRSVHKSDKACERAWEITEEGIRTMKVKLRLKALEKDMSSISKMLEVLSGESRNQW